jgi:hypothetical protein
MNRRDGLQEALLKLAPKMPRHEFGAVLDHALDSPGLKRATPDKAAWLSLVAYVRHVFTDYEDLLNEGYDPESARHFVVEDMETVLAGWGVTRKLVEDEDPAVD